MSGNANRISEETSIILFIVYALVIYFVINYFSWVFVGAWYYMRMVELMMLSFLPDWMNFNSVIPYEKGYELLSQYEPSQFNGSFIKEFDSNFGVFTSWIPALFVYLLYRKHGKRDRGTTQKFSMQEMLERQSKTFHFLKPYVNFNPASMEDLEFDRTDSHKLQFLPSLSNVEFATLVPALGLEKEAEEKEAFRMPIWDGEDMFDDDLARRCFEKQLGNHYTTIEESLTDSQMKVFEYISPRVGFDRPQIVKLIHSIRLGIAKGKGTFKPKGDERKKFTDRKMRLVKILEASYAKQVALHGEQAVIKEINSTEKTSKALSFDENLQSIYVQINAEEIMNRHGFVKTGLMSLLEEARNGGVLVCPEFQWLKGEDRALWYALHSVGRQTPFPEAGGAYVHWQLEVMVGRAITQPEVSEAVEGLKLALHCDKKSLKRRAKKKPDGGFVYGG